MLYAVELAPHEGQEREKAACRSQTASRSRFESASASTKELCLNARFPMPVAPRAAVGARAASERGGRGHGPIRRLTRRLGPPEQPARVGASFVSGPQGRPRRASGDGTRKAARVSPGGHGTTGRAENLPGDGDRSAAEAIGPEDAREMTLVRAFCTNRGSHEDPAADLGEEDRRHRPELRRRRSSRQGRSPRQGRGPAPIERGRTRVGAPERIRLREAIERGARLGAGSTALEARRLGVRRHDGHVFNAVRWRCQTKRSRFKQKVWSALIRSPRRTRAP